LPSCINSILETQEHSAGIISIDEYELVSQQQRLRVTLPGRGFLLAHLQVFKSHLDLVCFRTAAVTETVEPIDSTRGICFRGHLRTAQQPAGLFQDERIVHE